MNKMIDKFARGYILDGLKSLPEEKQRFFVRLYSPTDLKASIENTVKRLGQEQLDWAMQQVEQSLLDQKAA